MSNPYVWIKSVHGTDLHIFGKVCFNSNDKSGYEIRYRISCTRKKVLGSDLVEATALGISLRKYRATLRRFDALEEKPPGRKREESNSYFTSKQTAYEAARAIGNLCRYRLYVWQADDAESRKAYVYSKPSPVIKLLDKIVDEEDPNVRVRVICDMEEYINGRISAAEVKTLKSLYL